MKTKCGTSPIMQAQCKKRWPPLTTCFRTQNMALLVPWKNPITFKRSLHLVVRLHLIGSVFATMKRLMQIFRYHGHAFYFDRYVRNSKCFVNMILTGSEIFHDAFVLPSWHIERKISVHCNIFESSCKQLS